MKKAITMTIAGILTLGLMVGCQSNSGGASQEPGSTKAPSQKEDTITVLSREDGSGTRGAFIELFGIEETNADGKKEDMTIETADINNSTGIMLTNVEQNTSAVGYVSMGALKNTVKALKIDGAEATTENIKNGTYKIARPFNIATKEGLSDVAKDFIAFILSAQGQQVAADNGYIPNDNPAAYSGSKPSGKITVAGSSSVTPLMEKLKEAYLAVNTNASIDIQESDSTSGMTSTAEGVCDIGMASRDLKDSELEKGLTATVIATDGIAVIVNTQNSLDGLTSAQVKAIYTGELTKWSEVQ